MSNLRRILYILPQPVYPPDSGPKHHTFGLLKQITAKVECHVIGFSKNDQDSKAWNALEKVLPNLQVVRIVPQRKGAILALKRLGYFFCFRPVSFCSFQSADAVTALSELFASTEYDLVHFDTFNVSAYRTLCSHKPTVLIPYDAFSMSAKRAIGIVKSQWHKLSYWWKWQSYSRYDKSDSRKFTKVCAVSEVDTKWLLAEDAGIDAETIGIPVPDEFFAHSRRGYKVSQAPHIVVCGVLSHDAVAEGMIEFVEQIYPIIRAVLPSARVTVWGRDPVPRLRRALARTPDIEQVGFVPDYRGYLESATIYVYPQRYGAGIQTKVQQPMALGIPIVTRQHVLDGLNAQSGIHAIACDDNVSMAHTITTLIQDDNLRARIGMAGAEHIRESFNGETIGTKLEAVYKRAVDKHKRAHDNGRGSSA